MRLKTQLVLSATMLTSGIVLVLSTIFVGELLRQRIEQTASSNEVLAHEVLLMTRQAVETGLREHPPARAGEESFDAAVAAALQSHGPLMDVMQAIVRYSPTVQDVSVTRADGRTLLSTDPDAVDTVMAPRTDLVKIRDESVFRQTRQVFGRPRVLDLAEPLDRNHQPFLIVHVGVRSTFVRASYEPWLRAALLFAILAAVGAMIAAGLLANTALRPIEEISDRLETLAAREEEQPQRPEVQGEPKDAVVRMTQTIDRLGAQMRSTEAGYTTLRANVNQMLETLRDGVLLFSEDGRAAMASGAATYFFEPHGEGHGGANARGDLPARNGAGGCGALGVRQWRGADGRSGAAGGWPGGAIFARTHRRGNGAGHGHAGAAAGHGVRGTAGEGVGGLATAGGGGTTDGGGRARGEEPDQRDGGSSGAAAVEAGDDGRHGHGRSATAR